MHADYGLRLLSPGCGIQSILYQLALEVLKRLGLRALRRQILEELAERQVGGFDPSTRFHLVQQRLGDEMPRNADHGHDGAYAIFDRDLNLVVLAHGKELEQLFGKGDLIFGSDSKLELLGHHGPPAGEFLVAIHSIADWR